MKRVFLISTLLISLAGAGQHYIQASIQQGATANSVNIMFLPNYTNGPTEVVNYLSLAIAIPTASASGVNPDIVMTGPFTGMQMEKGIPFSFTQGPMTVYSWLYKSGVSPMSWTSGVPFAGATITFTGGTGSANVSLVDLTSCTLSGGANNNSFFLIVTNVSPFDVANYSNLFYSIAGTNGSTPGTTLCPGDPVIQTNLPIFLSSFCQAPVTPNVNGISTTAATITWNAVPGVGTYEYELTTNSTPTSPISTTSLSLSRPDLIPGTPYNFFIRSVCSPANYSGWTSISFATICPATNSVTPDSITPSGVKIKWGPVAAAGQGYQYAVTTGSGTPVPSSIKSTLSDSAVVTGLTEGTTYYAQVRINCSPGVFSQWIPQQFTTTYPKCEIPTSITGVSVVKDRVDFSWTPPLTGGIGYEYAVSTDSTAPLSGKSTSSTSASIGGLASNTQYNVFIRTQCGPGRYSKWMKQSFTTSCFKPIIYFVRNLETLGSADLAWHGVTGALKYEYAILNNGAPPAGSINFTPDTLVHISGLVPGNRYYLHVRTRCTATTLSDWSTQEFYASGLAVYPTSTNTFTISLYGTEIRNAVIDIFDSNGKMIRSLKGFGVSIEIDMNSFASGLYYLRYGKNRKYVKRVIKL
jgi:hypothetical protein